MADLDAINSKKSERLLIFLNVIDSRYSPKVLWMIRSSEILLIIFFLLKFTIFIDALFRALSDLMKGISWMIRMLFKHSVNKENRFSAFCK